jgi:hypothetical protein
MTEKGLYARDKLRVVARSGRSLQSKVRYSLVQFFQAKAESLVVFS